MSERLSMRELRAELKVAYGTLYRWRTRGVAGRVLRCERIGGQWFTRRDWLDAFVADYADLRSQACQVPRPRQSQGDGQRRKRNRRNDQARAQLMREGLVG